MFSTHQVTSSKSLMANWLRRVPWLLIPILALSFSVTYAQQLTATLSGIATDQTDARIPGARVVIKNDATGDIRETKTDSSGFFSVPALIPGTYTVTISVKGFATWEENGILLNQGDSRTLPNIHMKIGSEATAVTVISGADAEIPTDNAEISATLNNELVDSATLTGRNAAELIKMMPGVTFNNGGGAGSAYNSQTTGTNNGPAGSFSSNGSQPNGSTAVILDGANLIDPGNAGTQVANINQDMTDSVKYLSASYTPRALRFCRPSARAAARSSTAKPIFMPAIRASAMPTTGSTRRTRKVRQQHFQARRGSRSWRQIS